MWVPCILNWYYLFKLLLYHIVVYLACEKGLDTKFYDSSRRSLEVLRKGFDEWLALLKEDKEDFEYAKFTIQKVLTSTFFIRQPSELDTPKAKYRRTYSIWSSRIGDL